MTTTKFKTTGMHCASCSMLIELNLEDLDGVLAVVSDYRSGFTEVTYDPARVTETEVIHAINQAGYKATAA